MFPSKHLSKQYLFKTWLCPSWDGLQAFVGFGLLGLGLGLYLLQRLTRKTLNVKANDLVLHYKKPAFRVFSNLNRARFHQGEYNLNKNHIIITKKHIAYVHFIFRCLTTIKHFVHMHLYSRALTTLFPTTFIYI